MWFSSITSTTCEERGTPLSFGGGGGGGGDSAVTEIVAEACLLPPFPLAVSVYVVACDGETACEPLAATVPRPSMVTESALDVLQISVADCPA
jgi:hypothetical protein